MTNVRLITHTEDLAALAGPWRELAAAFPTPLLSYNWFHSCAQASNPPGRIMVVVISSGKELAAIAPLSLADRAGGGRLELLGNPFCNLGEPSGFLYRDRDALFDLVDAILSLRMPLHLNAMPANDDMRAAVGKLRPRCLAVAARPKSSLYVPTITDWSGFANQLTKSRRNNLRRKLKQAEKLGAVRFEVLNPGPDEWMQCFERFVSVEASGWKAQAGTALSCKPFQRRFFEVYGAKAAQDGTLRVFEMWIGDELAASRLAVTHSNRLWELKIGFDETFQRCSPGILLTHETLRYVIDSGLEAHEFLGEPEAWEQTWPTKANSYMTYRIYPISYKGCLGAGRDAYYSAINQGHRLMSKTLSR